MNNSFQFSEEMPSANSSIDQNLIQIIPENAERFEQRDQVLRMLLSHLNTETEGTEHLG
ncbi:hypothetical protein ACJVDH_10230 [Pedobacter sp. AW1-32]|uniref:hypothetical protein n=1 Tax=Pedobacter sp. AW1-32 TaxID=3383026 RepID=UPI003FEFBE0F